MPISKSILSEMANRLSELNKTIGSLNEIQKDFERQLSDIRQSIRELSTERSAIAKFFKENGIDFPKNTANV
mgnify:CR=1 FL=1